MKLHVILKVTHIHLEKLFTIKEKYLISLSLGGFLSAPICTNLRSFKALYAVHDTDFVLLPKTQFEHTYFGFWNIGKPLFRLSFIRSLRV